MKAFEDINERWSTFIIEEAKKKEKRQSRAGNRFHRGGIEKGETSRAGQFTTAEEADSESIGVFDPPKPNTIQGRYRRTGKGKQKVWVGGPAKCGRKNKEGTKKHKRKCSVKETLVSSDEDDVLLVKPHELEEMVLNTLSNIAEQLVEEETLDEQEGQRKCPPGCSTWEQFLRSVNALKAAQDGKLFQQQGSK